MNPKDTKLQGYLNPFHRAEYFYKSAYISSEILSLDYL